MRLRKHPRRRPLVAPSFEDIHKVNFICATAVSGPAMMIATEHYRNMASMREAQEWLEGIRADRALRLAWEYPAPPAFAAAA